MGGLFSVIRTVLSVFTVLLYYDFIEQTNDSHLTFVLQLLQPTFIHLDFLLQVTPTGTFTPISSFQVRIQTAGNFDLLLPVLSKTVKP